jgi:hypothetical protein
LQALLLERMGPSELEQILADGTRLGEDVVCRLARAN